MTRGRTLRVAVTALLMVVMFAVGWVVAKSGMGAGVDRASLSDLERQFTERLTGASLVGRFTIDGREDRPAAPDRYDISSVQKVGDDQWQFNTRMRYGRVDVTLPVTVTMRWIGDTPMITITDFSIPSLGTFTSRVIFHGNRYAGTWQHDSVGGIMFGHIEKPAKPGS
jgi:hypothetical protein